MAVSRQFGIGRNRPARALPRRSSRQPQTARPPIAAPASLSAPAPLGPGDEAPAAIALALGILRDAHAAGELSLALEAARVVLPYLAPRLATVTAAGPNGGPITVEILRLAHADDPAAQ